MCRISVSWPPKKDRDEGKALDVAKEAIERASKEKDDIEVLAPLPIDLLRLASKLGVLVYVVGHRTPLYVSPADGPVGEFPPSDAPNYFGRSRGCGCLI